MSYCRYWCDDVSMYPMEGHIICDGSQDWPHRIEFTKYSEAINHLTEHRERGEHIGEDSFDQLRAEQAIFGDDFPTKEEWDSWGTNSYECFDIVMYPLENCIVCGGGVHWKHGRMTFGTYSEAIDHLHVHAEKGDFITDDILNTLKYEQKLLGNDFPSQKVDDI